MSGYQSYPTVTVELTRLVLEMLIIRKHMIYKIIYMLYNKIDYVIYIVHSAMCKYYWQCLNFNSDIFMYLLSVIQDM